jgi:hypothetical protein
VAVALVALLPGTSAQSAARGFVTPSSAVPSGDLEITFVIPLSSPADVNVAESVSCTIADAAGRTTDCGSNTTLVDARVDPSTETYSFTTKAPTVPGNYTVHLSRSATVAIPGPVSATATFQVLDGALSTAAAPLGAGGGVLPSPSGDAPRWLLASGLGAAAVIGSLALTRSRGGA